MLKLIKKHALIAGLFVSFVLMPAGTDAAITNWQKAASMVPKHAEDFSSESFKQSLRDLKAVNANTVSLIVPYYTSNCNSSDVFASWNTPTNTSLANAMAYARSIGLQVTLKPHLEASDNWGGMCTWRANISPSDRTTFFSNYNAMLHRLAALGPNELTIGAELISISTNRDTRNTPAWKNIIAGLRTSYPSLKLNYSANWGSGDFSTETTQIGFWGDLDSIGVSGYYEHWTPTSPASVEEVKENWERWNNSNIKPLNTTYGKPVKFTEIGYKSTHQARQQPWNYDRNWGYSAEEQVNLYEAMFQYWNGQSFFNGVNLWHWDTDPNGGGEGNQDYFVQNKPAEAVIAKYFSGGTVPTPTPTPTPPPSGTPAFTSTGSTTPASPKVNQAVTVNVSLTNSGQAASGLIVDLEVYNSSGTRVLQKFFESQSFTAGQSKSYTASFTPSATGTYSLKVGVFNSNWSVNYYWKDQVDFSVTSATTTPPPTPTPNPPATCSGTGTGAFTACYFDNQDFTNLVTTKTDNAINFDWGTGSPVTGVGVDTFSAQWQGNFSFDAATYNFTATADDGIRVYVDNTLVLDKFIDQPATTYNFSRAMTAGTHLIKVMYYESGGGAVAKLSWSKQSSTTPPPAPTPTPTPTPTPPPAAAQVDIWWPTNGAIISGTQPFQAIVPGMSIDQYNMYWQVDGGVLNLMNTDATDGFSHKRSWVDVNGWLWNGTGPYNINFVARNLGGGLIAQKEINIHVAR